MNGVHELGDARKIHVHSSRSSVERANHARVAHAIINIISATLHRRTDARTRARRCSRPSRLEEEIRVHWSPWLEIARLGERHPPLVVEVQPPWDVRVARDAGKCIQCDDECGAVSWGSGQHRQGALPLLRRH